MKITFALPEMNATSGGLRVVAQYSRHLLDQGHELAFVIRRPRDVPGPARRLLGRLGLGRYAKPLSTEWGHFSGLNVPVHHLEETRPVCAAHVPDADIIVSTWWTTAEWANRLPQSKGRHVHFIQDYEDFTPKFSRRVRGVYRQNNHKIVVAGWLRDKLKTEFGCDSVLVTNGVDLAQFGAPPRDRNAIARIGFLYSTHPRKNGGLFFDVIRRIRVLRPDVRVLAFGAEALPAGSSDDINYERFPSQDRIAEIYRSCDLWLFVSKTEGFGLPLLEAMASRTPVVATPAGAAPDLIDGQNGRLTTLDAETFTQAVLAMLDQPPEEWRAASQAAFDTARAHTIQTAARQFDDVLTAVAAGQPVSAAIR